MQPRSTEPMRKMWCPPGPRGRVTRDEGEKGKSRSLGWWQEGREGNGGRGRIQAEKMFPEHTEGISGHLWFRDIPAA